MSLTHLLKKGKQAKQLDVQTGVGADTPPRARSKLWSHDHSFGEGHHHEWPLYRNQKQVGLNRVKILGGPLTWCAGKSSTLPTVAKLVRKYLAEQASSAASERLFPVEANRIISKRNRLRGETAAVFFLHETLKNKLSVVTGWLVLGVCANNSAVAGTRGLTSSTIEQH